MEGALLGERVGVLLGLTVGRMLGRFDGIFVGLNVGLTEGLTEGDTDGLTDGESVGDFVGGFVGFAEGDLLGLIEGGGVTHNGFDAKGSETTSLPHVLPRDLSAMTELASSSSTSVALLRRHKQPLASLVL